MRRLVLTALAFVAACSASIGDTGDAGSGGGSAAGGGGGSPAGGGGSGGSAGGFVIMVGGGGGGGTAQLGGGGNTGPFDAGPTGTATLNGSLGFTVREARAVLGLRFDGGVALTSVKVAMGDQLVGNPCSGTGVQGVVQGLLVAVATGDAGNLVPAVYPITGRLSRGGDVIRSDYYLDAGTAVISGTPQIADAGMVTITTFGSGHVVGSFDVAFDGTPLSGSFDAPFLVCP
jgi:hypothetical protein